MRPLTAFRNDSLVATSFSPVPPAAELCALARRLAHACGDSETAVWEAQLGHLVGQHLAEARDDVLADAMSQAETAHDEQAVDELGLQVEYEAEHQQLGTRPDGLLQEARLFAIPLIVSNTMQLESAHLPQHAATETLVATFRDQGLIAPSQGLTLVKYLYRPDELDAMSPSAVFRLCHQLAFAERDEVPGISVEAPVTADTTAGLRFLVGVVTGPAAAESLLLAADTPDDAAALEWADKVDDWCMCAAACLTELLGSRPGSTPAPSVEVFPVGGFFEARRLGEIIYKGTTTLAGILRVLRATGINPAKVSAVVAPYLLEDQSVAVVASLTSKYDGSLLGTVTHPISAFEQMDDALNDVHGMLETRVGEVAVVATLQPTERCDCCGDLMYLTPAQPGSAHLSSLPTQPAGLLH